jgi:hypothetical protein
MGSLKGRKVDGRSGGESQSPSVVRVLGGRDQANEFTGRLGCKLTDVTCRMTGGLIHFDVPKGAATLISGSPAIHAKGGSLPALRRDILRQINLSGGLGP